MATQPIAAERQSIDTSRFECIDGQFVDRPLPNEDHAATQLAVTVLLRRQANLLNYTALQEWTIDETDQPRHNWMTPDVLVASNAQARAASKPMLPPALLAVEILSPDQTVAEMHVKALRYFKWGVEHVWIIDPVSKSALTLNAKRPGKGEVIFDGIIEAGELHVNLSDIFSFR